jgi:hypothetical protein
LGPLELLDVGRIELVPRIAVVVHHDLKGHEEIPVAGLELDRQRRRTRIVQPAFAAFHVWSYRSGPGFSAGTRVRAAVQFGAGVGLASGHSSRHAVRIRSTGWPMLTRRPCTVSVQLTKCQWSLLIDLLTRVVCQDVETVTRRARWSEEDLFLCSEALALLNEQLQELRR